MAVLTAIAPQHVGHSALSTQNVWAVASGSVPPRARRAAPTHRHSIRPHPSPRLGRRLVPLRRSTAAPHDTERRQTRHRTGSLDGPNPQHLAVLHTQPSATQPSATLEHRVHSLPGAPSSSREHRDVVPRSSSRGEPRHTARSCPVAGRTALRVRLMRHHPSWRMPTSGSPTASRTCPKHAHGVAYVRTLRLASDGHCAVAKLTRGLFSPARRLSCRPTRRRAPAACTWGTWSCARATGRCIRDGSRACTRGS